MLHLLRLITFCALCLALLISTARWLGQHIPTAYAAYFSAADGTPCATPCVFGVQPAYFALAPIIKHLQAHPLIAASDQGLFNDDLAVFATDNFSVVVSQASDPVMFVTLLEPLPLGDVLAAFGTPSHTYFERTRRGLNQIVLFGGGRLSVEVWHTARATHNTPQAQVMRLGVAARGFNTQSAAAWRGLGVLRR
jgi:hypothetical protein